ncbi:MAG: winged helix-turn-helix domain-containing protein [Rhodoblastus sp.]|nr:MAG: winged helix-turn-helix domain-containing protein [Rhodoblastus sp.]
MLRVLARAAPRPVSRENLFAACWGDAERGWSGVERLLCRVRRKLAARGVTLRNDWGRDWWIDKADVAGLLERPQ